MLSVFDCYEKKTFIPTLQYNTCVATANIQPVNKICSMSQLEHTMWTESVEIKHITAKCSDYKKCEKQGKKQTKTSLEND